MSDTIAAIATAPGEGGIAIVRMSGPEAEAILMRLFRPADRSLSRLQARMLTYGRAVEGEEILDDCLAVIMRAPASYTREDVAELQLHGGNATALRVLQACLRAGARMAQPGEFTRRAFLNGRVDLSRAEAVMSLIRARGETSRRAAVRQLEGGASSFIRKAADELYSIQAGVAACVDYPEEITEEEACEGLIPRILALADTLDRAADEQGARIVREGLRAAIAGRPNVGKSSLLNAMMREEVAIVTPVAGTTRDVLHGEVTLGGALVQLADTAGLRATDDPVERIGVTRAEQTLTRADAVLLVVDGSSPLTEEDRRIAALAAGRTAAVVCNKSDLEQAVPETDLAALLPGAPVFRVCAKAPETLTSLRDWLAALAVAGDRLELIQPRHIEAAGRAARHLREAAVSMETAVDLASIDLQSAQEALAEITGDQVSERLLDRVFADFCVGK